MKHFKRITQGKPAPASALQDIVCILANTLVTFLSFLGGSEPTLDYLADKCSYPDPNANS